jgi:hypothetical protein
VGDAVTIAAIILMARVQTIHATLAIAKMQGSQL